MNERKLIYADDAIRWVKIECNPYGKPTLDFESGKKVIEYLERLPSAQPEQIARDIATIIENEKDMRVMLKNAEHTETHSCDYQRTETHDLVSRQAAIDALSQYPFEKAVNCISIIEELPSAQSESCEYCVLSLKANGWRGSAKIRYCPMCGRDLLVK